MKKYFLYLFLLYGFLGVVFVLPQKVRADSPPMTGVEIQIVAEGNFNGASTTGLITPNTPYRSGNPTNGDGVSDILSMHITAKAVSDPNAAYVMRGLQLCIIGEGDQRCAPKGTFGIADGKTNQSEITQRDGVRNLLNVAVGGQASGFAAPAAFGKLNICLIADGTSTTCTGDFTADGQSHSTQENFGGGNSNIHDVAISFVASAVPPPSAFTLSATETCNEVGLSWTASSDATSGYSVFRDSSFIGGTLSSQTSFVDTTAQPNDSHVYQVMASGQGGSTNSNTVNGKRVRCATGVTLNPPGPLTVGSGANQQFTLTAQFNDGTSANVTSDPNTTWSVRASCPNGQPSCRPPILVGSISSTGLFTAETLQAGQPDETGPVEGSFLGINSPRHTATAQVTVSTNPCAITVNPTSATVQISTTKQFVATPSNCSPSTVKWFVNGVLGGTSTLGTINQTGPIGTYNAPPAIPGQPQITIDNVSHANNDGTGGSPGVTFSHTIGNGTNRALLVNVGACTTLSVKFGTIGLTKVAQGNAHGADVTTWLLLAPAVGTNTVTVQASGNCMLVAGGVSYFGINQTTAIGATGFKGFDPGTSVSQTLTTTGTNSLIHSFTDWFEGTITPGATQRWLDVANTSFFLRGQVETKLAPTLGSYTITDTFSQTTFGSQQAIELIKAANVANPETVTITVISDADSSKQATAQATIIEPPPPPPCSFTISPTSVTVQTNGIQKFNSTNTCGVNAGNTRWSVNDILGGNTTVGTVPTSGSSVNYTAPATVPGSGSNPVTVTVFSVGDPTQKATATVTITPPPEAPVTFSGIFVGNNITISRSTITMSYDNRSALVPPPGFATVNLPVLQEGF